jgi:hypothetical protein
LNWLFADASSFVPQNLMVCIKRERLQAGDDICWHNEESAVAHWKTHVRIQLSIASLKTFIDRSLFSFTNSPHVVSLQIL